MIYGHRRSEFKIVNLIDPLTKIDFATLNSGLDSRELGEFTWKVLPPEGQNYMSRALFKGKKDFTGIFFCLLIEFLFF